MLAEPAILAGLVIVGVVAAVVNTVAGGGSFVTLSALVWLGVPAPIANATNRVGVFAQSLAAGQKFRAEAVEGGPDLWWQIAVTGAGSLVGSALSFWVPAGAFEVVLALMMLGMVGLTLRAPARWSEPPPPSPWRWAALGLSGMYGGFLQAGVGLLLLPCLVRLGGLDPVRANSRKVVLVGTLTLPALLLFAALDQVAWAHGAALAVGSAVGGWLGARLTVGYGARLVWTALVAIVVLTAGRLLWTAASG